MRRVHKPIVGSMLATAILVAPQLVAQTATLPHPVVLPVELDHRVRVRVGARVRGHLTEPVFLEDHSIFPAGAPVSGSIRNLFRGSRSDRVRRLLAGDFTPPRVPEVVFDSVTVPPMDGRPGRELRIEAPAVETNASILTLGRRTKRQTVVQQAKEAMAQRKQDALDNFESHHLVETVERWAINQLPYHPDLVWSRTRWNADLLAGGTVPDPAHPVLPHEDLHGRLPEGELRARLATPLSSATAKRGDVVEARITRPLLSADGQRLLVPEGTTLRGEVVKSRSARWLGRNGDLRFAFRNLDLPSAESGQPSMEIHGRLSAAETAPGQKVSIDEEGQAKAGNPPGKYAEPLLLGVLAAAAAPDDDSPGRPSLRGGTTVASNGFGLIARVVSLSTRNVQVLQGFAYYSLAKSIYFNLLSKGQDTTFARNTEIQVTLSER